MTDQRPLLPCPFCGAQPVVHNRVLGMRLMVQCSNQACTASVLGSDAINAWNTRLTAEQDGWVRVPVEPTEAMLEATMQIRSQPFIPAVWRAMIAARPTPPANILNSTKEAGL